MTPANPLPEGWPVMSMREAHALLTAPGSRLEMEEVNIRGNMTRVWKNLPGTLRDVLAVSQTYPDRTFVVYENDRVTFDAFGRAVRTLAAEFQKQGVTKGDRVALIMRNLPEFPVVFVAAASLGALVVPLNAWWTGPELAYGLADSGSKIVVVDPERLARIAEHLDECPALEKVYVSRYDDEIGDPRVCRLENVLGEANDWATLEAPELPDVSLQPDDEGAIFYTSGTTGKPKGGLTTHRNMISNTFATAVAQARMFIMAGQPLPDPDPHNNPQKAMLLVIPMFHVTGWDAISIPAMITGGKLVLMRKWDAEQALQLIERERVTNTGGVPTIAWQLIEHPNRHKYDLSSLEGISYGGAPSAPDLVKKIREMKVLPGNGYGMTETSATMTSHAGPEYDRYPSSAGPCCPVGSLKIMNLEGTEELPIGETGELWMFGPNVIIGYWNKPEATAQTFVKGWVKSGDLAYINEDGYLFIVDRAKDMLIRGGENIYCIEVENVLYDHHAVMDAALVGIPHRTLGEEPAAVVTLKPGAEATERELRAFVADRLAAFKVPVKVLFTRDVLPRNANGKIMKNELKKLFETEKA